MLWPDAEIALFRSRAGRILAANPRAGTIIAATLTALAEDGDPRTGKPITDLREWLRKTTTKTLTRTLAFVEAELLDAERIRSETGCRRGDIIELRGPAFGRWHNLRAAS